MVGYSQRPQLDGAESLFETKFMEPTYVGTGVEEPTTAPIIVDVVEPPAEAVVEAPEPKKSKKWMIIVGVVIAVALAAYSLI